MALDETQRGRPQPSPLQTPAQVVGLQLQALKDNDAPEPDTGIMVAFGFASPANRATTGPLERFVSLVHSPVYQPLLSFRAVQRGTMVVTDDQAQESVLILDGEGKTAVFVFALSRQIGGLYNGCWMTDGVLRA